MSKVLDKNYYPVPFEGGSTMISSATSGTGTLETHEFYDKNGKVVFYWKIKKDADGNITDFRSKVPAAPAEPASAYINYDNLA